MPPPYTPGSDIGAKSVAQQKLLSGAVILDFGSGAAVIGGGCTAFADEQGSTKIAAMTARDLAAANAVHRAPWSTVHRLKLTQNPSHPVNQSGK